MVIHSGSGIGLPMRHDETLLIVELDVEFYWVALPTSFGKSLQRIFLYTF